MQMPRSAISGHVIIEGGSGSPVLRAYFLTAKGTWDTSASVPDLALTPGTPKAFDWFLGNISPDWCVAVVAGAGAPTAVFAAATVQFNPAKGAA